MCLFSKQSSYATKRLLTNKQIKSIYNLTDLPHFPILRRDWCEWGHHWWNHSTDDQRQLGFNGWKWGRYRHRTRVGTMVCPIRAGDKNDRASFFMLGSLNWGVGQNCCHQDLRMNQARYNALKNLTAMYKNTIIFESIKQDKACKNPRATEYNPYIYTEIYQK